MTKEDKAKIAWLKHIETFQHEYKQLNERYINEISHCGKLGIQLVEMKVRLNSCNEELKISKEEIASKNKEILELMQKNLHSQGLLNAFREMERDYRKLKNKNWFQRLFNL